VSSKVEECCCAEGAVYGFSHQVDRMERAGGVCSSKEVPVPRSKSSIHEHINHAFCARCCRAVAHHVPGAGVLWGCGFRVVVWQCGAVRR